jgi:cold shock CspA family protein
MSHMVGRIKCVQRGQGTGYIREATGRDVFFHKGDVLDRGYNDLEVGTRVNFDIIDDPISGARAEHVRPIRRMKVTPGASRRPDGAF